MKEIRLTVPDELYRKYKVFCVENSLSISKQTGALIEEFLKIMNHNKMITEGKK